MINASFAEFILSERLPRIVMNTVINGCFDASVYAAYGTFWVGGCGQQYALYAVAVSIIDVAFNQFQKLEESLFPVKNLKQTLNKLATDSLGQILSKFIPNRSFIRLYYYQENLYEIIYGVSIKKKSDVKKIINSFIDKATYINYDNPSYATHLLIISQRIKKEPKLAYTREAIHNVIEKFLFSYEKNCSPNDESNRNSESKSDSDDETGRTGLMRRHVEGFSDAYIDHERNKFPNTMKFVVFLIAKLVIKDFLNRRCLKLINCRTSLSSFFHRIVYPNMISPAIKSGWNKMELPEIGHNPG